MGERTVASVCVPDTVSIVVFARALEKGPDLLSVRKLISAMGGHLVVMTSSVVWAT